MPLFLRKFIVDFIETGLAALLALVLVVPTDPEQAKETGIVIAAAVAGALIAAFRRAVPGFIEWIRAKLEVPSGA
jgi:hypothetical protein